MSVEPRDLELVNGYCSGSLTDAEFLELEERLRESCQLRQILVEYRSIESALPSALPPDTTQMAESGGGATENTERRKRSRVVVAAVVVVMVIAGFFFLLPEKPALDSDASQPLAVVTHSVGAYREEGIAVQAGERIEAGPLSIERGVLRLDFARGAKLAVEGPAKIEVVDEMRVVLLSGVITATIPESAIGFVVDTDTARVVDLGTAFGVSVGDDGTTDVCVFEGEVEVSPSENGQLGKVPHLLREGEAVRAVGGLNSVDSIVYDTSAFENAWPVNSGVLQTTGSMRFVSPGPDFHPGNYEDNEHILVFPERRGFVSSETIRVDMVDPGQYAKARHEDKPILLTKQRLTSYLLQLNAHPEGENPNRRRSVRGQITFAKPIVGVIMANRLLRESEVVFGLPGVEYPGPRMIEPRPAGDQRPGFDTVILAADRRTLMIELQENPRDLDQFRVLVEAE